MCAAVAAAFLVAALVRAPRAAQFGVQLTWMAGYTLYCLLRGFEARR